MTIFPLHKHVFFMTKHKKNIFIVFLFLQEVTDIRECAWTDLRVKRYGTGFFLCWIQREQKFESACIRIRFLFFQKVRSKIGFFLVDQNQIQVSGELDRIRVFFQGRSCFFRPESDPVYRRDPEKIESGSATLT